MFVMYGNSRFGYRDGTGASCQKSVLIKSLKFKFKFNVRGKIFINVYYIIIGSHVHTGMQLSDKHVPLRSTAGCVCMTILPARDSTLAKS